MLLIDNGSFISWKILVQIDDFEGAKRAGDLFGYPLMIKSRRLAYDGRGNAVAKNDEEISSAVNGIQKYFEMHAFIFSHVEYTSFLDLLPSLFLFIFIFVNGHISIV